MKAGIFEKVFTKKLKQTKNGTTIEIYLNSENDLYAKFSVFDNIDYCNKNNARISDDIINYIITETGNIPINNSLIISIKYLDGIHHEISFIEKIIKENIYKKLSIINKESKKIKIISFILALIGMLLIGINQIFPILENRYSLSQLIIVISWVFMWKAVDLIFFEKVKIMKEKGTLLKIYYSEILMEKLN